MESLLPFIVVGLIELPFLIGGSWLFYSRVDSPWARMAVSSLLVATFLMSVAPIPVACCGMSGAFPMAMFVLSAELRHYPEVIAIFGPWLLALGGAIFGIRVVSYALNQLWARAFADRQIPLLRSSRVDDRIQRRLDD